MKGGPPRSPHCEQPHEPGCDGEGPVEAGLLALPCPCPCHDPDDIPF